MAEKFVFSGRPFRVGPIDPAHAPLWFPSLMTLAKNSLMTSVAETIVELPSVDGVWKEERWKCLKSYLHDLPFKLRNKIYEEILATGEEEVAFQSFCQNCDKFSRMLCNEWKSVLNSEEFHFLVWWLFFDEQQSRTISNDKMLDSSLKLYLGSVKTNLVSIDGDRFYFLFFDDFFKNQEKIESVVMSLTQLPADDPIDLAGFWRLKSLTLRGGNYLVRKQISSLFDLLKSQASSLEELNLEVEELFSFVDLRFNEDLLKLLTEMPKLERLHLSGYQLHCLSKAAVLVDTLALKNSFFFNDQAKFHHEFYFSKIFIGHNLDQFAKGFQSGPGQSLPSIRKLSVTLGPFQKLEFSEETFPGLSEFHLKVENLDTSSLDHLDKVTHFTGLCCLVNPFEVISRLKKAKFVRLHSHPRKQCYGRYFPEVELPEDLQLPSLQDLELMFPKKMIRFQEFLFLFQLFPNVSSIRCNFYDVKNFDDDAFCKFVSDHRENSAELKSFNIRVRSFGGKMSLKTVGFLVQNTNLEFFEHLFNVRFIGDQFVNLAGIVKSKNLAIIPDFPTQSVENCWVLCRQGDHEPTVSEVPFDACDELYSSDTDSDDSSSASSSSSSSSMGSSSSSSSASMQNLSDVDFF